MAVSAKQRFWVAAHIWENGPCTRAALAKHLAAAAPTVSNLVRDMISAGLLIEGGHLKSAGGRRPALLQINPEYAQAVGVEVSSRGVCGVIANLAGRVRSERAALSQGGRSKDEVLEDLCQTIGELLERSPDCCPWGIGVGISGLVGKSGRVSREFPHAEGWKDVPVAELIEERFGVTPFMVNDVHAAALGERRFGGWLDAADAIYLQLGRGIAAGLIVDGKVYRGASGNAGELGHVAVRDDGPICYCGNRGCLETLAAPPAIEAQCAAAIQNGVRSSLAEPAGEDAGGLTIHDIFEAARSADRLACNLLEEAGACIGVALANLVNVHNPSVVMLGGVLAEEGCPLVDIIERSFRARVLPILRDATRLVPAGLRARACALGAAALVFDDLFSSPERLSGRAAGSEPGPARSIEPRDRGSNPVQRFGMEGDGRDESDHRR